MMQRIAVNRYHIPEKDVLRTYWEMIFRPNLRFRTFVDKDMMRILNQSVKGKKLIARAFKRLFALSEQILTSDDNLSSYYIPLSKATDILAHSAIPNEF